MALENMPTLGVGMANEQMGLSNISAATERVVGRPRPLGAIYFFAPRFFRSRQIRRAANPASRCRATSAGRSLFLANLARLEKPALTIVRGRCYKSRLFSLVRLSLNSSLKRKIMMRFLPRAKFALACLCFVGVLAAPAFAARPESSADDDYDSAAAPASERVGWLRPNYTQPNVDAPFALVDNAGQIRAFVRPVDNVRIGRYVNHRIRVRGAETALRDQPVGLMEVVEAGDPDAVLGRAPAPQSPPLAPPSASPGAVGARRPLGDRSRLPCSPSDRPATLSAECDKPPSTRFRSRWPRRSRRNRCRSRVRDWRRPTIHRPAPTPRNIPMPDSHRPMDHRPAR